MLGQYRNRFVASHVRRSHTRRGSSGALNLKSAIAGLKSWDKAFLCVVCAVILCVEEWVLRNLRL